MVKDEILSIAGKYATAISNEYNPLKVILFGSCAKGTDSEHSDIDIAVVFQDYPDNFDMQMNLMRLRRNIELRIEPHPFRLEDFNHDNPLASEVIKNGIEIDINQQTKQVEMVAESQEPYTTKQQ